jgi:hypothetical protein
VIGNMVWEFLKYLTLKLMALTAINIAGASLVLWSDRHVVKDALTVETYTELVSTQ